MKTLPEISINQSIQQPLSKWESLLKLSFSRFLSWVRGSFTRVRTSRLSQVSVHAAREAAAGLLALLLAISSRANHRIFVGLGLMGVVAPLSSCFYMLFDRSAFDETWYHANYFHFFLVLGPSFFILFCLVGAWLLFPEGSRRAYTLVVPAGFTVGKILWLARCTSNADFYSVVPFSFVFVGALISLFLFLAVDWLTHRKFHREDAFEARLENLVKLADDFDDAKFKSMIKTVWREKQAFKKQF